MKSTILKPHQCNICDTSYGHYGDLKKKIFPLFMRDKNHINGSFKMHVASVNEKQKPHKWDN